MKKFIFVCVALASSSSAVAQNEACARFEGATVVTDDGDYLGKVTNRYENDSIFNKYGNYGNKYNTESIWNKYGDYGSPYNPQSATNKFATTPPFLVKDRNIIGYLTKNRSLSGAVDPMLLGAICYGFDPD